ncbi:speckle-type POZ protein [Aedes albopictus]|uniref:BTB domain-containing protein n=1 Tax=Aedes albopictus TaxID=7160 RepID=A0ABM1YUL1_AEDAL
MENSAGSVKVVADTAHKVSWTFKFDRQRYTRSTDWKVESERFWIYGNAWKLCFQNRTFFDTDYYVDAYLMLIVDDQPKQDSIELSYRIHAMGHANCKTFSWACKPQKYSPLPNRGQFDMSVNADTFLANNEVFPEDMLTLRCDIIFEENPPPIPDCHLTNQLRMLTDGMFTDVTVVVGERQIRAHKVVLATHSPVFEAMLRANMQESSQNVIKIDDFEYEVVQEMMTYIYSDSSPKIENLVGSLLRAADKYDLGRLKALCEQTLCNKVSVHTAVEYQALATLCNAAQLQRSVTVFITNNIAEVLKTDDWQRMVQMFSLSYICQKDKQNVEHDDKEDHD